MKINRDAPLFIPKNKSSHENNQSCQKITIFQRNPKTKETETKKVKL